MPIDIAHYQNWATQHANTEVAIRQGNPELEQASNQVGFFARFFNTSSAKNARQAVMTDFTRTLSAKYGATLAQQALKDVGLSPASKLVGSTISAVIDRANNLRANALAHAGAADLRLKTGTITQADIGGYGDNGRAYVQNYLTTRMLAIDALGEMPLDADSLQDFRERVDSIKTACSLPDDAVCQTSPTTFQVTLANTSWTFFRENIEGEYIWGNKGIQVDDDLAVDFKVLTRPGAERICSRKWPGTCHPA